MHQTKEYSFAVVVRGARGKRSKMRRRVSAFLLSYAATAMYDDHSCTSKKKDYHEGVAADEALNKHTQTPPLNKVLQQAMPFAMA
jgi:hypothetical protein